MNSQSSTQASHEISQQVFDIHKKLKEFNNGLSYAFPASPYHAGKNYLLNQSFEGDGEYSLYKRVSSNFVLVDFFTDLDSACDEAKEIIKASGMHKRIFDSDDDANQ